MNTFEKTLFQKIWSRGGGGGERAQMVLGEWTEVVIHMISFTIQEGRRERRENEEADHFHSVKRMKISCWERSRNESSRNLTDRRIQIREYFLLELFALFKQTKYGR